MKRSLILLFLGALLTSVSSLAQTKSPLEEIREELFYTDFNFERCEQFFDKIVALKSEVATIIAYEASAEALMAKHTWNPIAKFNYLNNAQKRLETAIALENDNLEIRFLRLYIEQSIPSYLGRSKNIDEDKKMIIRNLDKLYEMGITRDIIDYIITYITSPKVSTDEEIAEIKKKISKRPSS